MCSNTKYEREICHIVVIYMYKFIPDPEKLDTGCEHIRPFGQPNKNESFLKCKLPRAAGLTI